MFIIIRKRHILFVILIFAITYGTGLFAQEVKNDKIEEINKPKQNTYFYHGYKYGSESQFGPLNVFMNIGFSFMSIDNINAQISTLPFNDNVKLMRQLSSEESIKEEYGSISKFIYTEFMPILGKSSHPNYVLHFLGEGIAYRKLSEYFLYQGFSTVTSNLMSATVMTATQVMNEIIEAPYVVPGDALADFIFNAAGIVALSFDSFARLFYNDYLRVLYWSGQPVIDVQDTVIYNQAEGYLLRSTMGSWTDAKFGFLIGIPAMGAGISFAAKTLGLSGIMKKGDMFSLFAVFHTSLMPEYPYKYSKPILLAEMDSEGMIGIRLTWDRDDSLIQSLEYSFGKSWALTWNFYPSFLRMAVLPLVFMDITDIERRARLRLRLTKYPRYLEYGVLP